MPFLLRLLRRFARVVLVLAIRWVVRAVRVARGRPAGGSSGTRRPGGAVIDVEPRGMFDRFSDPARHAVARSVELARREGRHRAEVGHLLLALATGDTVVAAMLREHGVDPADLRTALARGAGAGAPSHAGDDPAGADPPVSLAVARILERAPRSARRAGRFDVTPRDLLQAIAEVDDPDLRALLRRTGVPEDTLRRAVGL